MNCKPIYNGNLDIVSLRKMSLLVRKCVVSAVYDNYREYLNDRQCIFLLPEYFSIYEFDKICKSLGLLSCRVVLQYLGSPHFHAGSCNCVVIFYRSQICKTFISK